MTQLASSEPPDARRRASILHCLPVGLSEPGGVGTGTVMRTSTLRGYAMETGFNEVEVLPIENDFWRFYRLVP